MVYYESHGFGIDYMTCLVGSGWHDMIDAAGGVNIFSDVIIHTQPKSKGSVHSFEVDPEAILIKNPDLILRMMPGAEALIGTGTYFPNPQSEMKETWQRLVSRPGWSQLNAVKNNQVYVAVLPAFGAYCKLMGTVQLAKWLYPDIFPDLDPEAIMRNWYEEYQGVDYPGGYTYEPN